MLIDFTETDISQTFLFPLRTILLIVLVKKSLKKVMPGPEETKGYILPQYLEAKQR
jgi:hypothetical protein